MNADGDISTGQGVLGNNMFAYCGNNSVSRSDYSGQSWKDIGDWFAKTFNAVSNWCKDVDKKIKDSLSPYKNKDNTYSLYDNNRFKKRTSFHEQAIVGTISGPSFDLEEGNIGLGSVEVDITTAGWEFENVDISAFDLGHAEVAAEIKDGNINVEAMVSAWSPSISFNFFNIAKVEIGVEVGAIGAGGEVSDKGISGSFASGIGGSISISWD